MQRSKQQLAWADKDKVSCGDFELTNVYNFCYLGHLFQGDGDHSHDLETRFPSLYATKSRVLCGISARSLNHTVDRREIL